MALDPDLQQRLARAGAELSAAMQAVDKAAILGDFDLLQRARARQEQAQDIMNALGLEVTRGIRPPTPEQEGA